MENRHLNDALPCLNTDLTYRYEEIEQFWIDHWEEADPITSFGPNTPSDATILIDPYVQSNKIESRGDSEQAIKNWLGEFQTRDTLLPDGRVLNFPGKIPPLKIELVPSDNYGKLPYAPVGKLFFKFKDRLHFATAFVIAGQNPNALLTAGHCVYSLHSRVCATDLIFLPFYREEIEGADADGEMKPMDVSTRIKNGERYHITRTWLTRGYKERRIADLDLGCMVAQPRPGQPDLQSLTGAIGWVAGGIKNYRDWSGNILALGYPRNGRVCLNRGFRFDGKKLWKNSGRFRYACREIPCLQMEDNTMVRGASGGPWLIVKDRRIYALGINASISCSPPTIRWSSPRFGIAFRNLMKRTEQELEVERSS